VLDRFLLFGDESLLDIVKSVLLSQKPKILRMRDAFELQIYMAKQMYLDALVEGTFFPPYKSQN